MSAAITTGDWTGECFVRAGEDLQQLVEMEPFQEGFLAANHDAQQGEFGNGRAAFMLQGQWAPGSSASNSESGEGIGDALAWASFPAVEGGAGQLTDVFGGGDNFVVGRDAPPEAVDFLEYLTTNVDVVEEWAGIGDGTLPTLVGSEAFVADPNLQSILAARSEATFAQGYLDQVDEPRARRGHQRCGGRSGGRSAVPRGDDRGHHGRGRPRGLSPSIRTTTVSGSAFAPARSSSI